VCIYNFRGLKPKAQSLKLFLIKESKYVFKVRFSDFAHFLSFSTVSFQSGRWKAFQARVHEFTP